MAMACLPVLLGHQHGRRVDHIVLARRLCPLHLGTTSCHGWPPPKAESARLLHLSDGRIEQEARPGRDREMTVSPRSLARRSPTDRAEKPASGREASVEGDKKRKLDRSRAKRDDAGSRLLSSAMNLAHGRR